MKKELLGIDGASILNNNELKSISGGGGNQSVCTGCSAQNASCGPHHVCMCDGTLCVDYQEEIPSICELTYCS